MHLVQLLLPLSAPDGRRFPMALYEQTAGELTTRFGGLTAYARAPATGLWDEQPGQTQRDEIVVYEIMVRSLNRRWWTGYRRKLESRFQQKELVIRALAIQRF